ncbi:hypothetical protein [Pinibacter aurantiacus]|uniref:Uncharacterized protein n=1 Tax=Pinibacter aurantiacus TaxID=2851599 RepID=A0A9E2S7X3_9BACT|nr:hypothetical protein [Pinibacter aurantiacus]MBV4356608.1 hypothetical protein [Pinibacter aurantiacus]
MKFFLKSKHWQLFIVVVGIPLVMQIIAGAVMMVRMFSSVFSNSLPDFPGIFRFMSVAVPVIVITMVLIFFSWFYTLGINLHRKLPASVKMNLNPFLIFISFPVLHLVALSFFMSYMYSHAMHPYNQEVPTYFPFLFFLIIPLHLFAMFCAVYCLYFVSKALKSVELQREALLGDYILDMLLFWFFIVGIWFLQPRINKLFTDDDAQLMHEGV